jgi:hypothetical protein
MSTRADSGGLDLVNVGSALVALDLVLPLAVFVVRLDVALGHDAHLSSECADLPHPEGPRNAIETYPETTN